MRYPSSRTSLATWASVFVVIGVIDCVCLLRDYPMVPSQLHALALVVGMTAMVSGLVGRYTGDLIELGRRMERARYPSRPQGPRHSRVDQNEVVPLDRYRLKPDPYRPRAVRRMG
jgi:hypothetical protein